MIRRPHLHRLLLPTLRAAHAQPAAAVTAVTTALAWATGRRRGVLGVAAAVGAGQLAVGWSNDWLDRERDAVAGRFDKPIVAGEVPAGVVGAGAVAAAVACVPLSLSSGWRAGLVHLGAVGAALAYNGGVKATAASPAPYAVAFGALPAFVTLGAAGHPLPRFAVVLSGALLGCGAHFVNAAPDVAADRRAGVWGLPQRLGESGSVFAGAGLLLAAAAVAVGGPGSGGLLTRVGLPVVAASAAGVVVASTSGRERTAWTLTLATAVATVGVFLAQGRSLVSLPRG